jgi:hypothetical protein
LNYLVKVSYNIQSSTEIEVPLNISVSLPIAYVAEGHRAEGQLRRLKSTLNKLKCLKFGSYTRRPTVSIREGQYFVLFTWWIIQIKLNFHHPLVLCYNRLIIRSKRYNFDTTGLLRDLLRASFLYFLPWTLYTLDLKKRPLTDS